MKQQCNPLKWMPLALAGLALACWPGAANAAQNIVMAPGAIQPGGDPNDNTVDWGTWFSDQGVGAESFDSSTSSKTNIAGSILVDLSCYGNTGDGDSANLAFGNWLSEAASGGWLGAPSALTVDASQYASLDMDIMVDTTVSSNTPVPIYLWGAGYNNAFLTNVSITSPGWQHLSIPIPPTIDLPNCVAWGFYDWYNTTATTPPAYAQFWIDNVTLVAKVAGPPPPTLSIAPVTQSGLFIDAGPGESGERGGIDTIVDVHWSGLTAGAPIVYSMDVTSVPNPRIYSNYEAHIFLATIAGLQAPDWNSTDCGYLQILDNADGTATARLMWKTNDPYDNTMFSNTNFGGLGGTNNAFAAGTLGSLQAPTMLGTWSITFTSDTNITVAGPKGVSTNFVLPPDWLASLNASVNSAGAVYAYFGADPGTSNNTAQGMTLGNVSIYGGEGNYGDTNSFSTAAYDTTTWGLFGETSIIPQPSGYWLWWTLPAANFGLWSTADLGGTNQWLPVTGNANLADPVTPYTWGQNLKALVLGPDLPDSDQTYFELRKLEAVQLQVLMPGETNAPGTVTGKTGAPISQEVGNYFDVTVNAVDAKWNVVPYNNDTVTITSSDTNISFVISGTVNLTAGTATVSMEFGTAGSQTVTATDTTQASVSPNTGSATTVTP
ncbi:MAG: hypothetical protein ABSG59_07815 [Verrucomicrobiota bacterium]|jgi:hypothetical protein